MGNLVYKPWPGNFRVRIRTAAGTLFDVSQYVDRHGLSIEVAGDMSNATATIPLQVPNNVALGFVPENWQEVRIDNTTPLTGTAYERYFKGFITEVNSDPAAEQHYWTLSVVSPQILLQHNQAAIVGPMTWPIGTSDQTIITWILSQAGLTEISTAGVNNLFNLTAPFTLQNTDADAALQLLQEAAPSTVTAYYMVGYAYDDPPTHSDDWSLVLRWYTPAIVGASSVDLADVLPESSTKALYRGMTRSRRGLQVVNRQTVIGKDYYTGQPIMYTAQDATSQAYLGRWLSAKPIVDETLTSMAACQARADMEIARWKDVLETLSNIRTLMPILPSLQGGLTVKIKRDTEAGLGTYTSYLISRCRLQFDAAGNAEYVLTLGTEMPRIGERGTGWRGGVRYAVDTTAPATPTWANVPATDWPTNQYIDSPPSVMLIANWNPSPEGDILDYWVQWKLDSGGWVDLGFLPDSQATLTGLPYSTGALSHTATFRLKARDTSLNISAAWSADHTVTLASVVLPAPPTALALDATAYPPVGYGWDDAGAWAAIKWTAPIPAADSYWLRVIKVADNSILEERMVAAIYSNVVIHAMVRGFSYSVQIASQSAGGIRGAFSVAFVWLALAGLPAPPTGLALDTTNYSPNGYGYEGATSWLALKFVAPVGSYPPADSYWLRVTRTSDSRVIWEQMVAATYSTVVIHNLYRGEQYYYEMASQDAYGHRGTYSTGFTQTIPNGQATAPTLSVPTTWYEAGIDRSGARYKWTAATAGPGLTIRRYAVCVLVGGVEGNVYWVNGTTLQYDDTLPPNASVAVYVVAEDSLGFIGIASATQSFTAAAPLILPNASFEKPDLNDATLPADWVRSVSGLATATRDSAAAWVGGFGLRLSQPGSGGGSPQMKSARFAVSPGSRLTISFMAKLTSGTDYMQATVEFYDASGAATGGGVGGVWNGTTTWTKYDLTTIGEVPAGTAFATVYFKINDPMPTHATTMYVDNVQAIESPAGAVLGDTGGGGAITSKSLTAFPSVGLLVGQRVQRIDRPASPEYVWDGSRWLGEPVWPQFVIGNGVAQPYTVTSDCYYAVPMDDLPWFMERFQVMYLVNGGTHNIGNYWTIKLQRRDSGGTYADLAAIVTDKLTVSAFVKPASVSSFSANPLNASDTLIKIRAEATGTPGPLYLQFSLRGRQVG